MEEPERAAYRRQTAGRGVVVASLEVILITSPHDARDTVTLDVRDGFDAQIGADSTHADVLRLDPWRGHALSGPVAIAVLPFQNLSADHVEAVADLHAVLGAAVEHDHLAGADELLGRDLRDDGPLEVDLGGGRVDVLELPLERADPLAALDDVHRVEFAQGGD